MSDTSLLSSSSYPRNVFITGAAESPLGIVRDHSELSMVHMAAAEALTEAGLTFADVDGIFVNYMGEMGSVQVAEYLGLTGVRYHDSTDLGGGAFETFVHHAAAAISAGVCSVALIAYASRQRSRRERLYSITDDGYSLAGQFEVPSGIVAPMGYYGLIAARHMYEYGTTPYQLAEVASATREWAALNPKAFNRQPMTPYEALAEPYIIEPLRKSDICLLTDGGGAVIVTDAAHARSATKLPVRVLSGAEAASHWSISQMPDATTTPGAISGQRALELAGLQATDIDVLEIYDATTINVIIALEDLGFCGKGEGGPLVEDGSLRPSGRRPAQTSGGGLSYCHPGAFGILLLIEAVRQVRGECEARQLKQHRTALVHGFGGLMSAASSVVLAHD